MTENQKEKASHLIMAIGVASTVRVLKGSQVVFWTATRLDLINNKQIMIENIPIRREDLANSKVLGNTITLPDGYEIVLFEEQPMNRILPENFQED